MGVLGADADEPAALVCAYCWPRLIAADQIDEAGKPCCEACSWRIGKTTMAPSFLFKVGD